jgi:peptidyl-dipeptidase Dcp
MTDRNGDQPAPRTLDLSPAAEALLAPWTGPCGGTPPFDVAEPASIESAYRVAIARKREEVAAIASDPAPPTFENTIAALEDAGRALRRVDTLFRVFSSTRSSGEMREVETRLKPLLPALEDEIAHDDALFARIRAVDQSAEQAGLTPEEIRLTRVVRDRLSLRGAGLEPGARARLAQISGRIAELSAAFSQNLLADEEGQQVPLDDEADLEGLDEEFRGVLASAAVSRGLSARWGPQRAPTSCRSVLFGASRGQGTGLAHKCGAAGTPARTTTGPSSPRSSACAGRRPGSSASRPTPTSPRPTGSRGRRRTPSPS